MKTSEDPNDPLAHYAEKINPLRAAKAKHDQQVEDNRRKLAEAEAERAEHQHAGPPDEALVRQLAESHIRVELYRNHQAKLDARTVELLNEAEQITVDYSVELKMAAANAENAARKLLIAEVGRLVVNGERDIVNSLNSYGIGVVLISHEERMARLLRASAEYRRHDGDPFAAFDFMRKQWREFIAAIAQAQAGKRETIMATPA